jgi:hypothetical protein
MFGHMPSKRDTSGDEEELNVAAKITSHAPKNTHISDFFTAYHTINYSSI